MNGPQISKILQDFSGGTKSLQSLQILVFRALGGFGEATSNYMRVLEGSR